MHIRAFNQYIDMYFQEHPSLDNETLMHAIETCEQQSEYFISSDYIFKSDDNILVLRHPFAANGRRHPHSHDYFELIYVSRGNCTQIINDRECNLKEGDLCLLNPNDKHFIDIGHPDDLLFNIMIKPSLFRESFLCLIAENDFISNFFLTSLFTVSKQNSFLYFPRYITSSSGTIVQSLIKEFFEQQLGYRKSMECYLALLFTELMRCHREQIDQENYEMMGNNQLSAILAYMNQHKTVVTLSSVAKEFHYHPNYLSSLIKKYTNKSFSEIIQEAKLQEACYYLRYSEASIEEIVMLLGYYDRSYFNRVFKKHYDMSPNDFRKSHRMQNDINSSSA